MSTLLVAMTPAAIDSGDWFLWTVTFCVGAAIGSFLNVCIYRIPYEKSLFWPGSRCGKCFQRLPSDLRNRL